MCRDIKLLVHTVVLRSVDGLNHSSEAEEVVTSIPFTALRVTGRYLFSLIDYDS